MPGTKCFICILPNPSRMEGWSHDYFWSTAKRAAAQQVGAMCSGHRAGQKEPGFETTPVWVQSRGTGQGPLLSGSVVLCCILSLFVSMVYCCL